MLKRFFPTVFTLFLCTIASYAEAKYADLAGSWYPASPETLRSEIEKYLRSAKIKSIKGALLGAVAPHAGLGFSGTVAAYTYKTLAEAAPKTVIVVGFTHKAYFPGRISVFTDEYFTTPLGKARIDLALAKEFIEYDEKIESIPEAFSSENSVEMQIPFIQTALTDPTLVLLALCDQRWPTIELAADALSHILRDKKDFVIIASTDMSHYMDYKSAQKRDEETIKLVSSNDAGLLYQESLKHGHELMCGVGAVCAVMDACKKLGSDRVEILKYANSGDTSGIKDRVVGYLSAAFIGTNRNAIHDSRSPLGEAEGSTIHEKREGSMFNQDQKNRLLKIARDSITYYLKTGKRLSIEETDEALKKDLGAFVTLRKNGELRGCIGQMTATDPLYLTICSMAFAAATQDPRFPPVTLDELDEIDIEISTLSPMERVTDCSIIEMGKHGVMVCQGRRSGVYLPQVADETGWERDEFLTSLCAHKAGISPDAWRTGECDIYIFTADVFGEKEQK